MLRKVTCSLAFLAAIAAAASVLAADPTVDQIYQAARSGRIVEAEQMIGQVLADHPRSGKAHWVAAEVYARAGDRAKAGAELATAETLSPGLPFVNDREMISALRAQLARSPDRAAPRVVYAPHAQRHSSVPWGLILVIVSGVVIVWSLAAARRRRLAAYPQYPGNPYPGQPYPGQPMGMPPGGIGPMGGAPYPYGYGGRGSGLMSSLGTGLAVGAGVAAGEALVNRVLDGPHAGGVIPPAGAGELTQEPPAVNQDMGGNDFGVSGGSWDDGGGADFGTGGDFGGDFGGGGDDWT